jgi:hypothetical protein
MYKKMAIALIVLLLSAAIITAQDSTHKKSTVLPAKDSMSSVRIKENLLSIGEMVYFPGLPYMGKWMYTSDLNRAHWLGVLWQNKKLYEPINIILLDSVAKTPEEAVQRLEDKLKIAGFTSQDYHSSGYCGFIGDNYYSQLPALPHHAYADGPSYKANNHGRIFGPHYSHNMFVFIGAFSREVLDTTAKIKHRYDSFNRARDALSQSLNTKGAGVILRFVNLENAVVNDSTASTGDHDGVAVVVKFK